MCMKLSRHVLQLHLCFNKNSKQLYALVFQSRLKEGEGHFKI